VSGPQLSVVTWNMEWKQPGSAAAKLMLERIAAQDPDIICLTEAYRDVLAALGGYQIEAEADYGYPITEGRRKVLLWSSEPWSASDRLGSSGLPPGRFVSGRTATPLGELTIVGVCISWRGAHVSTGRRDRTPWQDHCRYLEHLAPILARTPGPTIVVGDYNQQVPRTRVPQPVHEALDAALGERLRIVTTGQLAPLDLPTIDHIALSPDLEAEAVTALDHRDHLGKLISDHFGVAARIGPSMQSRNPS
jgi:endonuclease/exonuclease/phosphatase family metal-dependent hydrolase